MQTTEKTKACVHINEWNDTKTERLMQYEQMSIYAYKLCHRPNIQIVSRQNMLQYLTERIFSNAFNFNLKQWYFLR